MYYFGNGGMVVGRVEKVSAGYGFVDKMFVLLFFVGVDCGSLLIIR